MRIGIDFDGTIADTNSIKSKWILSELGIIVPPYLCDRTSAVPIIGEDNYARMRKEVCSETNTAKLVPVEGFDSTLKEMSQYSDIFLFTARNNSLRFAQDWLEIHGLLKYFQPSDLPTYGTKLERCFVLGINILIDDDPRHLPSASDKSVYGILFKPNAPRSYQIADFKICRSWKEIGDFARILA